MDKNKIYSYLIFIAMIYVAIDLSSMVFTYKIIEIGSFFGAASSQWATQVLHQFAISINRLIKVPDDPKKTKKASSAPLSEMKSFSIHDLRRSAATAWGEYLKVKPHVIEQMLNHQPLNKLVAIYQRATYAEAQKAAWIAWGEMVEHQIANDPENVVPIHTVAHG